MDIRTDPPEPGTGAERAWLAGVLTTGIPLSGAMAVEIAALDEAGITLAAPLAPNVNDKGTAFGGSLASLMILAGWSLPRLLLARHGIAAELLISRCGIEFLAPVPGDFRAFCPWPAASETAQFLDRLTARGRGRLDLAPEIRCAGRVAARLTGRYAAIVTESPSRNPR